MGRGGYYGKSGVGRRGLEREARGRNSMYFQKPGAGDAKRTLKADDEWS